MSRSRRPSSSDNDGRHDEISTIRDGSGGCSRFSYHAIVFSCGSVEDNSRGTPCQLAEGCTHVRGLGPRSPSSLTRKRNVLFGQHIRDLSSQHIDPGSMYCCSCCINHGLL